MHTKAIIEELEIKAFTVKNQNTKQATDMQVTFVLEIKLQEKHFLAKYDYFFN